LQHQVGLAKVQVNPRIVAKPRRTDHLSKDGLSARDMFANSNRFASSI
jgi:hypothetical protein